MTAPLLTGMLHGNIFSTITSSKARVVVLAGDDSLVCSSVGGVELVPSTDGLDEVSIDLTVVVRDEELLVSCATKGLCVPDQE